MKRTLLLIAALVSATPASAQTSVSAALSGDFTRSFETTTDGLPSDDTEREAIGWALRVGTAFGPRWGVELEFHKSGELEGSSGPILYSQRVSWTSTGLTPPVTLDPADLSIPAFAFETRQSTTTWNASAWVRQPIGARADLVVLGGMGFSRVAQESAFSFAGSPLLPIVRAPSAVKTIAYGAGAMVGVEARIDMTEHLSLTPGVRVQSLGNELAPGLLLRPSVALGWTF